MGSHLSKPPSSSSSSRVESLKEIFDTSMLHRMSQALSSLSFNPNPHSISFESLKDITTYFLELNQEAVKIILECKKDIWKSPDLLNLVEEYFDNSLQTLDFCATLDRCVKRARDSQLAIHLALQHLEEEEEEEEEAKYEKTLEGLKLFKESGDPFTEDFYIEFQAVHRRQRSMLEKLFLRKRRLDRKLKSLKAWRRVSCVIFAAAFASVIICSIVTAPPVAMIFAAASSIPLGSLGKWFDSMLRDYENEVKGEKEVIGSMQIGAFVVVNDLDNVRVMVDELEIHVRYLIDCVDFALKDEEIVRIGIEGIKEKIGLFMKKIEDLGDQADLCSRDIRRARTVVLQRIIKYPKE